MRDDAPGWLRRWREAWLLATAAITLETVGVCILARHEFAGGFEITLALSTLLPLACALALVPSAVGAVASAAVEQGRTRSGKVGGALLAACFFGAVAFGCSTGRHFVGSRRPAFVLLSVALGAALGIGVTGVLARTLEALRAKSRVAVLLLLAGGFVAVEIANQRVLPRLYPAFHLGLAVLALALVGLAGPVVRSLGSRVLDAVAAIALVSALCLGALAPKRVHLHDNLRWIFLERAPLVGRAVEVAALVAPPPPLDDAPEEERTATVEHALDLGGRDILLVTIDALRADHVGAYGYTRGTTPRLDALAREGAVFDAAYTATPHTSYAVTSLMTGKYMRPLLLQGLGADSETLAEALRRYDFHTAAFYPPAVFFVDKERFASFESRALGFEYRKEQFSPAGARAAELQSYLDTRAKSDRLFVWVHLFEPHEPYVAHPEHDFGERAIDRYDAEIAAADQGLGAIVDAMRAARPDAMVVVTADHGEEFGEHGGRYHGTSVYDEQVRVPLVFHAKGLIPAGRVGSPVGLIDIMPTLLGAARIPASPRVRGRDLGAALLGRGEPAGAAFSETDEHTLYAKDTRRLVCARKIGACRLHDIASDPGETVDLSSTRGADVASLKAEQRRLVASLGRYEAGANEGWPDALRRGLSGDTDAAEDVASLLGDADVRIRRKAAETLFELAQPAIVEGDPRDRRGSSGAALGDDVAEPLRRALASDEDGTVRRFAALALTRLGQGAPLTFDLVKGIDGDGERIGDAPDARGWKRLAALALAEVGDGRGVDVLVEWWAAGFPDGDQAPESTPFERQRQLLAALSALRAKDAVLPLTRGLADVRLRRHIARALAAIGDDKARPALAAALRDEPYHDGRSTLARALVALGGRAELVAPLTRYLGVPDPIPDGLALAEEADVLAWIGGPSSNDRSRLVRFATSGVSVALRLPEASEDTGQGQGQGARVVVRTRTRDGNPGEVRVAVKPGPRAVEDRTRPVPKSAPVLDPARSVTLRVASTNLIEVHATLPAEIAPRPGDAVDLVVYATQNVEVSSLVLVPLAVERTPPPKAVEPEP